MSQYATMDDQYLFPVMCMQTKVTSPGDRIWMCMADEHESAPDRHYWVVV